MLISEFNRQLIAKMKLLLIEDDEEDVAVCKTSAHRYMHEFDRRIQIVECGSAEEALPILDSSFDGAIVDLKLRGKPGEGNAILASLRSSCTRIPVVILTGTPDDFTHGFTIIGLFKKGEVEYQKVFDTLWNFVSTGITRIMGGRGVIEQTLTDIFARNIIPHIDSWVDYAAADPSLTERAMLRHVVNHLSQLLDDDSDKFFPDEFFIIPPLHVSTKTGGIFKQRSSGEYFVVLNPACDLVIRGGGTFKTDRVLLAHLDTFDESVGQQLGKTTKSAARKDLLSNAFRNNYVSHLHWVPQTAVFEGGFINFRKLLTLGPEECAADFEGPVVQISPSFVKDIISRFSSYYARQGQPDIDSSRVIQALLGE